jgi:protein-S-isoprenylcysteine O-methyltransferase Ste14
LLVWFIAGLWIALVLVWIVSGLSAKRTARGGGWKAWAGTRIIVAAAVTLVILDRPLLRTVATYQRAINAHPAIGALGVVLCAAGVALAIWARRTLGRNWGLPMTLKEAPELVIDGPYAHVRHPIYSGILLAALGSTLVVLVWVVPLIVLAGYFIYSARKEEQLMLAQFPDRYPAYVGRTRMLIPFVL